MTAHRFIVGLAAACGILWGIVSGCASISDADSGPGQPCLGPNCTPVDSSIDKKPPETSAPEAAPDAPTVIHVLCGDVEQCVPDFGDPGACADADAGGSPGLEAGTAEGGFEDTDGESPFSPPNTGSSAPEAGPAPSFGCQVTSGQSGEPVSVCMPAGAGLAGAPCVKSTDCAAGFACVGDANAAQCRPYCCQGDETCPAETFCAERPLSETAGAVPQLVPVCVRADNCSLSEPYPCPSGSTCTCEGDTACMVVRDKLTSCVVPGSGQEGESCPCAWGHMCSKSVNECLKLCTTAASQPECGSKKCTPMPYLPPDWGVCN